MLALLDARRAVALLWVLQIAVLDTQTSQCQGDFVGRDTYEVPGAGTAVVGALVPSELIDQHTGIAVQVGRAAATAIGAAWFIVRAIGLVGILEDAGLERSLS